MYSKSKIGTLRKIIQLNYSLFPKISQKFFARKTRRYKEIYALINTSLIGDITKHPYDLIPYNHSDVFNIAHRQIL
jgi:hypothetical protein